jgi:glycerophosphoryl diester phosphodiesterase
VDARWTFVARVSSSCNVLVIAHRAFGAQNAANTVPAVEQAARQADVVEVDVRRSGSGDLVVCHFGNLRWTTGATGQVEDRSADTLSALSVEGSRSGVPRLREVLDAVPSDARVELDLKEPAIAADAIEVAAESDAETFFASFYSDALWEVRSFDESARLVYNFDARMDRNLTTARLLDCSQVNVHWTACLTTDVVERAHERGIDVWAFPVGSRPVASALGAAGVDGLVATQTGMSEWGDRGRRLAEAVRSG